MPHRVERIFLTLVVAALVSAPVAASERQGARASTSRVDVTLVARAAHPEREVVSFGVPLPAGLLADASMVRVVRPDGEEIEALARPLEPWRLQGREGTIRSVLVQFSLDFSKARSQSVTVVLGQPRTKDVTRFVKVADTLLDSKGLSGPRVWAVLPAKWLSESGIAGPQVPASESGELAAYDRWMAVNFPGSLRYLNSTEFDHWLYDRPTGYYKMYIRTGELKYLQAGYEAANFVRLHTRMEGPLAGVFTIKEEIDLKYVYPRAMHLHYLLTGDERALEAGNLMARLWLNGWDPGYKPGKQNAKVGDSGWAARYEGYGLLGVLHGWEMTGDRLFWEKARQYADAVYEHQTRPPDGRASDGSFRTFRQTDKGLQASSSPWMTAILLDGLFHYWTLTDDARIPGMVARWCDFLDRHGMVPDGSQAYYMIRSPVSDPGVTPSDIGPDMELHNPEVAYMFAMGVYFSQDRSRTDAYRKRFERAFQLATALDHHNVLDHRALAGRETEPSIRSFNWSFQASSQLIYFVKNAPYRKRP